MATVIRAEHLALGRTVLAVPLAPARSHAAQVIRSVATAPVAESTAQMPKPVVDAQALRQSIESEFRRSFDERWQAAIDGEREVARREGFAVGRDEGRHEARSDTQRAQAETRAQVKTALDALASAHGDAVARWQADIADIAYVSVCQIIGERGSSKEVVASLVERVCQQLEAREDMVVRLHTRDAQLLGEEADQIILSSGLRVRIVADDSLSAGACIVDTPSGRLDASVDTQLRRLHAVLRGQTAEDGWPCTP